MKVDYAQSSVVSREHPPIFRLLKTGADDGVYPQGLVLAEKYDEDENVVACPYEEVADEAMTGTIDGTNKAFTLAGTGPVQPGTVVIENNNTSAQSLMDNGFGVLSGDGSGTVDYETGDIAASFTTAPAEGKTVTASYTRRVAGVAKEDIDTAKDTAILALVHGIAVKGKVVIDKDGTAVSDAAAKHLAKLPGGVWLQ
jgi:hypothetical protein